ncbi:MAG: class I SAM-dependent methyltransferase [Gemmatimonadaceae bacterium]|nr:class I SAM-dependent methyltransferase [Gemmatimonadaceae bacterium]
MGDALSPARKTAPDRQPTTKPWWATQFDAQYLHEYEPLFDLVQDRREVSRLIEVLALPAGARVLDCPCGQGRHAHLLAEAGFDVDGLDYSEDLLQVARTRGTGKTLRYTQGDMRRLPSRWSGRFDAVVNLFTSFGFFDDPRDDLQVLEEFARVLKPGGVLVWHGGARDGVMAKFLTRDWWSAADGTVFGQERSFDPLSGFLEITSTWRGPQGHGERSHRIRLYSASELAHRMRDVGLVVEAAFDSWQPRPLTRRSSEMMLVARKEK